MRRAAHSSLALALGLTILGCGAAPVPPPTVTGLVVAIHYSGAVATVGVSGAAETSGRRFGPWTLSASTLGSGGTVGFIFDAADGGSAMICAESRDADANMIDMRCQLFTVRAGQILDGELTLGAGRNEH